MTVGEPSSANSPRSSKARSRATRRAQFVTAFGVIEVVLPQTCCGEVHRRTQQSRDLARHLEAGSIRARDRRLDDRRPRGAVGRRSQGSRVSLDDASRPSPSRMRMTMVRGPGQTNSARTGTPMPRLTRNVTSTRKRSSSSGTSMSVGALTTVNLANEYGWNHAPCHGSRRLAMMSSGSHFPINVTTPGMDVDAGGLIGTTGTGVGSSPPSSSSRTHTRTPSSNAGTGRQPALPFGLNASPCHRHTNASHSIFAVSSAAPRCGHAPGPICTLPAESRHATNSVVPT